MNIEKAIATLQAALRQKYGTDLYTETGAATISIAHDRVELTNPNGKVITARAATVARKLGEGR